MILTSLGYQNDPLYKDKSIVHIKIPGKYIWVSEILGLCVGSVFNSDSF